MKCRQQPLRNTFAIVSTPLSEMDCIIHNSPRSVTFGKSLFFSMMNNRSRSKRTRGSIHVQARRREGRRGLPKSRKRFQLMYTNIY